MTQAEERVQVAQEFLELLFGDAPSGTLFSSAEFYRSPEKRGRAQFYFHKVSHIKEAAMKIVGLSDVRHAEMYVRCSVLKEKPLAGRGKKSHTAGSSVCWVDLDNLPQDKLITKLKGFRLPPSWVNLSGKGLHAFWKLKDFCTDIDAIERRNRWLASQLGADHCWDITHILRVPGTMNHKYAPPARVKRLAWPEEIREYALDEIDEAQIPEAEAGLDYAFEESPLTQDFILQLPDTLQKRITTGEGATLNAKGKIDRSENDWYIALKLLELGFTPGHCLAVLAHPSWLSGAKAREVGYGYALHTVAQAVFVHQAQTQPSIENKLLDDVVRDVLSMVDPKTGAIRKRRVFRGADLYEPAIKALKDRGSKFYVDEDYSGYVVTPDGRVLAADREDPEFRKWLAIHTGFSEEEPEHRILRSGLDAYARERGAPASLVPWCYIDVQSWTFYLVLDAKGTQVLKVVPGHDPSVVPNGTDGKLLRKSGLSVRPIVWDPQVSPQLGLGYFYEDITRCLAMDPIHKGILTCYCFAAPLTYGFPIQTYPMLHLTGPSGGGKSQTLMLLSTWFHGQAKLLNTTPAASYRIASKEVFLPFDDYEQLPDDVKQFILTSSTGITRQKAGRGMSDVVSQSAHILMALTSIAELETEALRRRALVIPVNRAQHTTPDYHEDHWRLISARRSQLWSSYCVWLAHHALPALATVDFHQAVHLVESYLSLTTFKGLAPFLALLWIVGKHLEPFIPGIFGTSPSTPEVVLPLWAEKLGLLDPDELSGRRPLLSALHSAFEAYLTHPQGLLVDVKWVEGADEFESRKRVVESLLRDAHYRLQFTSHRTLPKVADEEWIGLEGSVTEWMVTLNAATRGLFRVDNEKKLGHMFTSLIEQDPVFMNGTKISEPIDIWGLRFVKILNAGPYQNSRGWRVLMHRSLTAAEHS